MANAMTSATVGEVGADYIDLQQVDPNYNPIEDDVYTLRVIKAGLAKSVKGNSYAKITFAVAKHDKHSGRRLSAFFFNITDPSSRDSKDLRKISDATGVQASRGFEAWLEELTQVQPEFKVPVQKVDAMDWTTKQVKVDEKTGETIKDNKINFRNAQPA